MKRFFLNHFFITPVFRRGIAIWFKNNQAVLEEIKCHATYKVVVLTKRWDPRLIFRRMGKIGYSCSM